LAHITVSKFDDHLPLYRQAEIYAREGVTLETSTLSGWVGATAAAVAPLLDALRRDVMASEVLHGDDTPVPVLAPGAGKTRTGRLWVYVRDERSFGGERSPAAAFFYSPDRAGERPRSHLKDFTGVLHADGYAGFKGLYRGNQIVEAACRVGGDVASPAPHRPGRADFPHPVLHAQASLTEQHIGGRSSPKAVGAERAWFGSVTTANCCAALAA